MEVTPISPGDLIDAIFGPTEVLGTSLSCSEEIDISLTGGLYYYQECEAALEELRIEFLGEAQMEENRKSTQARLDAIKSAGDGLTGPDDLRKAFGDSFDFSGFFDKAASAENSFEIEICENGGARFASVRHIPTGYGADFYATGEEDEWQDNNGMLSNCSSEIVSAARDAATHALTPPPE